MVETNYNGVQIWSWALKLLNFAEMIILFENQRQFLNSFNLVFANSFAAKLLVSGVPTQGI